MDDVFQNALSYICKGVFKDVHKDVMIDVFIKVIKTVFTFRMVIVLFDNTNKLKRQNIHDQINDLPTI